jgi:hypothetical protein
MEDPSTNGLEPIVMILGPSGVGKTDTSKCIERMLQFLRVDFDRDTPFETNGFPREWDYNLGEVNLSLLATETRTRATAKGKRGVVMSFATIHVFTRQQLEEASAVGIVPVALMGSEERCINARRERQLKRNKNFNEHAYRRKNKATFETYNRPEFDDIRLETFRADGSRWDCGELVSQIRRRLDGPDTQAQPK